SSQKIRPLTGRSSPWGESSICRMEGVSGVGQWRSLLCRPKRLQALSDGLSAEKIKARGVPLDGFHETTGDRLDHRRRRHRMPAVNAYELQNPFHRLEHRNVDVAVHPIDALQFEHDMIPPNFRHALWCSEFRLPSWFATHGPVINQSSGEPHVTCSLV